MEIELSADIGLSRTDPINDFLRPWSAAAAGEIGLRAAGGLDVHVAAAVDYRGVGFVSVRLGTWGHVKRKDGETLSTAAGVSILLTPLVESEVTPLGGSGVEMETGLSSGNDKPVAGGGALALWLPPIDANDVSGAFGARSYVRIAIDDRGLGLHLVPFSATLLAASLNRTGGFTFSGAGLSYQLAGSRAPRRR